MMFLGNLLFAGVLGKSTGNANLAVLIQKNIVERVDPSFRTHKAEHVGISTRDVSARSLKVKLSDFMPSGIIKEIKNMIHNQIFFRWLLIVASGLSILNFIVLIFGQVGISDIIQYDATGEIMALLMVVGTVLSLSGRSGSRWSVWATWGGLVLLVDILAFVFARFLPGATDVIELIFMSLNLLLAMPLLFIPLFQWVFSVKR